jgi:hypothetical protein
MRASQSGLRMSLRAKHRSLCTIGPHGTPTQAPVMNSQNLQHLQREEEDSDISKSMEPSFSSQIWRLLTTEGIGVHASSLSMPALLGTKRRILCCILVCRPVFPEVSRAIVPPQAVQPLPAHYIALWMLAAQG